MGLLSKNLQILRFRTDVPGNALFSVYIKYADDASGPSGRPRGPVSPPRHEQYGAIFFLFRLTYE